MNSKKSILFLSIIVTITTICIIIFIGYIIFKNGLEIMYGKKISEKTIIERFNANYNSYKQFVETLNNENNIIFEKDILSYDILLYEEEKLVKVLDTSEEEYKQYINSVAILQELNIDCASKDNGNVWFSINSIFCLGQYIIYMNDEENFPYKNAIVYKKNLLENWYYVELEI